MSVLIPTCRMLKGADKKHRTSAGAPRAAKIASEAVIVQRVTAVVGNARVLLQCVSVIPMSAAIAGLGKHSQLCSSLQICSTQSGRGSSINRENTGSAV